MTTATVKPPSATPALTRQRRNREAWDYVMSAYDPSRVNASAGDGRRATGFYAVASAHPMLSQEDMARLAAIAQRGDSAQARQAARDTLVVHNLRLVLNIAARYQRHAYSLDPDDLIAEGVIGLMRAIDDWQPDRARFATYATWWIRQAVARALCEQDRAIRVPDWLTQGQARAVKVRDALLATLGRDPTDDELRAAGCSREQVVALHTPIPQRPVSFDRPVDDTSDSHNDGGAEERSYATWIADTRPDADVAGRVEAKLARQEIARLLAAHLTPREALILALRFGLAGVDSDGAAPVWTPLAALSRRADREELGAGMTLAEIGRRLHLSRERIRSIEETALDKLRAALTAEGRNGL